MAAGNFSLTKTLYQETSHNFENFHSKSKKYFQKRNHTFFQQNFHRGQNNVIKYRCRESSYQRFNTNIDNCNFRQNVSLHKHRHKFKKIYNKSRVKYLCKDKEMIEIGIKDEKHTFSNPKDGVICKRNPNCNKLVNQNLSTNLPHVFKKLEGINLEHLEKKSLEDRKFTSSDICCDNENAKCWIMEDNFEKNDCLIFKDGIRSRAHSWPTRTKRLISYTSVSDQNAHFEKNKRSIVSLSQQLNLNTKSENVISSSKVEDCNNDSHESPDLIESDLSNLPETFVNNNFSKNLQVSSDSTHFDHPSKFSSSSVLSKNADIAVLETLPDSTDVSSLENQFNTSLNLHDCLYSNSVVSNTENFKKNKSKINCSQFSQCHNSYLTNPVYFSNINIESDSIINCKSKEIPENVIKVCPNCQHINRLELCQCSYCGFCLSDVPPSYRNKLSSQSRIQTQEDLKFLKFTETESKKQLKLHPKNVDREKVHGFLPSCSRKASLNYYKSLITDSNGFQSPNACLNFFQPHCELSHSNFSFNNVDMNNSVISGREVVGNMLDKNNKFQIPRLGPIPPWSLNGKIRTVDGRNSFLPWQEQSRYCNNSHYFGAVPKQKFGFASNYHGGTDDQFLGRRRTMTEHSLRSDYYLQSSNIHWPISFHKTDNHLNRTSVITKPQRGGSSLSFSEVEEFVVSSVMKEESNTAKNCFLKEDGCNQKGHNLKKTLKSISTVKNGEVGEIPYLPDEIMLHVFSFLSHHDLIKCALACSRFCRIVDDTSLWRSIVIRRNNNLCDDWLVQIGKRQPNNLSIIQCHGEKISSTGLQLLFSMCAESLKEMRFTSCSRGLLNGDTILLHAASFCHRLTYLDVSWCSVNDNAVCVISDTIQRLETLCLNGCQTITDVAITYVVKKHGHSLRTLEIYGCFCITARSMQSLAIHCKNLTTLNLGQCHKLSDACIANLVVHLKNIENLDLRGCQQIRNNCIRKVARNCPKLRTLALANCPQISDMALVDLSLHIPNLRSIDVCGCKNFTNASVKALASNCQQLEYLDLSSTSINHKSVNLLASYCNKRLESLKLSFCRDITEDCIIKLASYCKRLKTLHLYGCKNIRDLKAALIGNPQLVIEM